MRRKAHRKTKARFPVGPLATALVVIALGVPRPDLDAQERPVPNAPTTSAALPPLEISPGAAFRRALVFPGWGHAAIGSYTRGGFYFTAQGAILYTALRTRVRVGESQDRVRFREGVLLDRLAKEGVTDPEEIQQRLDDDRDLSELRGLLDSRKEQQEDMVALGLFFFLISGVDAYVSAHLARFPDPLELDARPGPGGTVDLALRVPLPR
ncbi:MAG: DUF5683 domain-containing protein [Gemmatimonadota bacterium]|nr:DUF5683 domain-containing protein [Gemmatimonadota bacterium]